MIKFRKAIQVGRNATDILNLPCVIGCQKEFWSDSDIRLRFELFGDTQSTKFRWGESIYAYHGDWLCEDYDGKWHLLTDKEYKDGVEDREQCAGA